VSKSKVTLFAPHGGYVIYAEPLNEFLTDEYVGGVRLHLGDGRIIITNLPMLIETKLEEPKD